MRGTTRLLFHGKEDTWIVQRSNYAEKKKYRCMFCLYVKKKLKHNLTLHLWAHLFLFWKDVRKRKGNQFHFLWNICITCVFFLTRIDAKYRYERWRVEDFNDADSGNFQAVTQWEAREWRTRSPTGKCTGSDKVEHSSTFVDLVDCVQTNIAFARQNVFLFNLKGFTLISLLASS